MLPCGLALSSESDLVQYPSRVRSALSFCGTVQHALSRGRVVQLQAGGYSNRAAERVASVRASRSSRRFFRSAVENRPSSKNARMRPGKSVEGGVGVNTNASCPPSVGRLRSAGGV